MKKLLLCYLFILTGILSGCSETNVSIDEKENIDITLYSEVGTINDFAIYKLKGNLCSPGITVTDAEIWIEYSYNCLEIQNENIYILEENGNYFDLIAAIESELISVEELEELIEISYIFPG